MIEATIMYSLEFIEIDEHEAQDDDVGKCECHVTQPPVQ